MLDIFRYGQGHASISLAIGREIDQKPLNANGRGANGQITRNIVQFGCLGFDLDNSYVALSSASALLNVFLKREFNQHSNVNSLRVDIEDGGHLVLYIRKVSFQDGRQPHLAFGIEGLEKNLTMSKPFVHQFDGALRKGMNWISPWPVIL